MSLLAAVSAAFHRASHLKNNRNISKEVAALRAANASCGLRGREPKGGLLIFTRQRSGSRWFVDTLGERSGTRRPASNLSRRGRETPSNNGPHGHLPEHRRHHRGPKEGMAVESHLSELRGPRGKSPTRADASERTLRRGISAR